MKVVIGLSGGVDSSVTSYLLKEQGHEVIAMTMDTWQSDTPNPAVEDAKKVAQYLDIPHYVIDLKKEFRHEIIDYFVDSYLSGRTPNPCCLCNRKMKWQALLDAASQYGADTVGTGHYARIVQLPNGRYSVMKALHDKKDQAYMLFNLTQAQLAHTIMPLGEYSKEEIREIARKAGIPLAEKPDSQDNCFITDNDYAKFITEYAKSKAQAKAYELAAKPGWFVSTTGERLGPHKGFYHYTIGQRKGLGIALGKPVFVCAIHPEKNEVVLGDAQDLMTDTVTINHVNYMGLNPEEEAVKEQLSGNGIALTGKIRYAHKGDACVCRFGETPDQLMVQFETSQRAITPGQGLVLYDEEGHIGAGGWIS